MFVGGVVVRRLIVAGIGHRSYSGIRRGDGYVDVLRCAQREYVDVPQFLVDEPHAHREFILRFVCDVTPPLLRPDTVFEFQRTDQVPNPSSFSLQGPFRASATLNLQYKKEENADPRRRSSPSCAAAGGVARDAVFAPGGCCVRP